MRGESFVRNDECEIANVICRVSHLEGIFFQALLQVCGTATNAFENLAVSGGLAARRLLLLDSSSRTKHVDAEVLVNGRWIVVDPAFRVILRSPDGQTLTRDELMNWRFPPPFLPQRGIFPITIPDIVSS